jgi:Secretion system C-terminal sorting domain
VYSTILRDWFCLPPADVDSVLLKNYQYLPVIKSTACNMPIDQLNALGDNLIKNYPNPFVNNTTITFKTDGGHTLVQVFDATGRRIAVLADKLYAPGTYTVSFNEAGLGAGVYYARLQNGAIQQVRPMLKVQG